MIIDVIPFFNEIEVLKTRLELLKGVVDWHIIVEGTHTYKGDPKPLYLDGLDLPMNVERHVVDLSGTFETAWQRETAQRDAIGQFLKGYDANDIVLYTDTDELPDPRRVDEWYSATEFQHALLEMRVFYYGLQWEDPVPIRRPKVFRLWQADLDHFDDFRWINPPDWNTIEDGGWHISYWGEPQRRVQKLQAFSHQEYNNPRDHRRLSRGHVDGRGPNRERLIPAILDSVHPTVVERLR